MLEESGVEGEGESESDDGGRTMMEWSNYQKKVFEFVETGTGSANVEAVAGSGKTTTLVECAKRVDEWKSTLVVAFNTRIREELTKRLPPSIPAITFNALGYRAWKAFTDKQQEVDKFKITKIIKNMYPNLNTVTAQGIRRLVDLGKMKGIVPTYVQDVKGLWDDNDETWEGLLQEYYIDFGYFDEKRAVDLARQVMAESIRVGADKIDFNDQIYLPVIFRAPFPQYDVIFIDEAQDVSAIQHEMIERSGSNARVIAFGDPHQAIYHFRGAGRDAMSKLGKRFNSVTFPLSISYRCPKEVIKVAQEYVPHIMCADDAKDGVVGNGSLEIGNLRTTDVILCRNNAPIVKLAFSILRTGKVCKVLGRDIGQGLAALVKKMKATSNSDLLRKLDKYVETESQKMDADQLTRLQDRVDTVKVFIENASSPEAVLAKIETMFTDDTGKCVLLSTVHKFKGLEAERVYLLDFHLIGAYAKTESDKESEKNIAYVAVTRAMEELRFVKSL